LAFFGKRFVLLFRCKGLIFTGRHSISATGDVLSCNSVLQVDLVLCAIACTAMVLLTGCCFI
jgi:hypothetical protein